LKTIRPDGGADLLAAVGADVLVLGELAIDGNRSTSGDLPGVGYDA
jgi:hypothetical protein